MCANDINNFETYFHMNYILKKGSKYVISAFDQSSHVHKRKGGKGGRGKRNESKWERVNGMGKGEWDEGDGETEKGKCGEEQGKSGKENGERHQQSARPATACVHQLSFARIERQIG